MPDGDLISEDQRHDFYGEKTEDIFEVSKVTVYWGYYHSNLMASQVLVGRLNVNREKMKVKEWTEIIINLQY